MPIATQLAISIELTKLVKLVRFLPPTAEKVFELARALQCSGSDLVTEEDILELFGRSRIEQNMAASFRTAVSASTHTPLCEQILLEGGPGPTIRRALSPGQDAYFSMVVQCSLLATFFRSDAIAAELRAILESQVLNSRISQETNEAKAVASEEQINGFLLACQEQTTGYPWSNLLLAVGLQFGISEDSIYGSIPHTVLSGLITFLPAVQQLRENRFIHVDIGTEQGVAFLVVWIHHLLGLTVAVCQYPETSKVTTTLGIGEAQVVIDVRSVVWDGTVELRESSFTFLQAESDGTKSELFRMAEEKDVPPISSIRRIRAYEFGKLLTAPVDDIQGPDTHVGSQSMQAIVRVMIQLICGYAIVLSQNFIMIHEYDSGSSQVEAWDSDHTQDESDVDEPLDADGVLDDSHDDSDNSDTNFIDSIPPYGITKQQILRAANFLFGPKSLNSDEISSYTTQFAKMQLNHKTEAPGVIKAVLKRSNFDDWKIESVWRKLVDSSKQLSIVLLAFSHVDNLDDCVDLPLIANLKLLQELPIMQDVKVWEGDGKLSVLPTTWFHTIACLMVEDYKLAMQQYPDSSLISDRGWSIYLSSFLQPENNHISTSHDPSFIQPGRFRICKGVPCRFEVRKHFIVDGPDKGRLQDFEWQVEEAAGDEANLRNANTIKVGSSLYGERQDSFVFSLRLIHIDRGEQLTRRTGFFELFTSIWQVRLSESCDHDLRIRNKLTLEPGYATVSGFGDTPPSPRDRLPRVLICLTANDTPSRWRALIAVLNSKIMSGRYGTDHQRAVLIRGNNCCFQCAIDQIAHLRTKWYVIL